MAQPARLLDFRIREDGAAYETSSATPIARPHVTMIADDVVDALAERHGLAALGLYLILDRMANNDGQCWPSESTLASRCGMSERHIRRIVNSALVPGGWVRKTERISRTGATIGIVYTLPHHRNARTNGADTTPDMGADMGADTTPARVSAKVVRSREEVERSIPPTAGTAPSAEPKPEPKPLPTNGPAQTLVSAWADATGVLPANYRKSVGQAQALVKAGVTAADVPDLVAYLRGEDWLRGAIDLGTALSQADKFRASRIAARQPPRDSPVPPSRMSRAERQSAERAADRQQRLAALTNRSPPQHDDADVIDIGGRVQP